jgi:hypothetical protein
MQPCDSVLLASAALLGGGLVLSRDPASREVGAALYACLLALMLLIFEAPRVSWAQLAVGGAALAVVLRRAAARIGRDEASRS